MPAVVAEVARDIVVGLKVLGCQCNLQRCSPKVVESDRIIKKHGVWYGILVITSVGQLKSDHVNN